MKRFVIALAALGLAVAHPRPASAQSGAGSMPSALATPAASPFEASGSPVRSASLADWRRTGQAPRAVDARAAFVSPAGRNGAIAGALLGAAGGAFVGYVYDAACEYTCGTQAHNVTGGALLGLGAGALVGWGIGEAWHALNR